MFGYRRIIGQLFALCFLVGVTWFGYARIISDIHLAAADYFVKIHGKPKVLIIKHRPKALDAAVKAYKSNPWNRTPLAMVGGLLVMAGNLKGGIKILEKYIEVNPYDLGPLINLGIAYHIIGRQQDADKIRGRVKAINSEYVGYIKLRKQG